MEFKVLSHAGLLVKHNDVSLICDPWIIGSCYWRSWWNYPPVSPELVSSLKPDFIYLTHIHWDHFHGPSLEKFSKETAFIVPKGNYSRIKKDLIKLGFKNVTELKHGESFELTDNFRIISYQFGIFLDSAVLIEADGVKLLNLNDSKHMGPTLKQIVDRHHPIDFVFRSHSSANSRLSYQLMDKPEEKIDDIGKYIEDFAWTVRASGARYAVPFASNHCHLHKDTFSFNKYIQDPALVKAYFELNGIKTPELKVMLSGDSWNSEDGFSISDKDWFSGKEKILEDYRDSYAEKLKVFYQKEEKAKLPLKVVQKYFSKLAEATPGLIRNRFKGNKITYVLRLTEDKHLLFEVDFYSGHVSELDSFDDGSNPIQVHTTAFIMQQCIVFDIFSHMSIGKRVFYRVRSDKKKYMELLNTVFNLYEYDLIPLQKNFSGRSIQTWLLRWRELVLYACLVRDKVFTGRMELKKYLKPYVQSR
jgi:UDP-MurNAc hydroxylase